MLTILTLALSAGRAWTQAAPPAFRPPAVPLVTSDPYLSIWSEADRLTDDVTRHWTHHEHPLISLIRVDGRVFRLMGISPAGVPALLRTGIRVTPTRSIYDFEGAGVHATLTFMTAALPDDLDALTRPLTYLTWSVRAADGRGHEVSLYDSTDALLAVNTPDQKVEWSRQTMGRLTALRVGTVNQPLLTPPGDDVRIDWGYAYVAPPRQADALGHRQQRRPGQRLRRLRGAAGQGRRPDASRGLPRLPGPSVRVRARRCRRAAGLAPLDDRL